VWRTGANEATSFVTTADVMLGDVHVPAGKYTLYTIPDATDWTIIVNKQTGQWGTEYDQKQDLGRTKVKAVKTSAPVPQFTISFDKADGKKTAMNLEWENTKVSVPIMEH
jgi:alpha-tubulin suppressor-like RCC1 family protein